MTESKLIAVVIPDGSIGLEWTKVSQPEDSISRTRSVLEKEMYRRYASDTDDWRFLLDEDPALFFTLRKVDLNDLVSLAVKETTGALLKKAQQKTGVNVAAIKEKTGVDLVKIRNILFQLVKRGAIASVAKGVYKANGEITTPFSRPTSHVTS